MRLPPLNVRHPTPPHTFFLFFFQSSQEAVPSTKMPLAQPPSHLPSTSTDPACLPSHTLTSAAPLPPPPHAVALEPPPVSSQLCSLILAGADADLPSLLTVCLTIGCKSSSKIFDTISVIITAKHHPVTPSPTSFIFSMRRKE